MILLHRRQRPLINMHLAKIIFKPIHSKQFSGNFTFLTNHIDLLQLLFNIWLHFFIGFSNVLEIRSVFFEAKHLPEVTIGHGVDTFGFLQMLKLFGFVKVV
jgi:hypothetical protein